MMRIPQGTSESMVKGGGPDGEVPGEAGEAMYCQDRLQERGEDAFTLQERVRLST